MKKILLVFSLFFAFSQLNAQGLRVGIKGGGSTTWLLNQNVFDADKRIDHEATFGANVGASVTYMFTDMVGLSLDVLYTGVNQKYNGEVGGSGPFNDETYTIKEKLRYIELPLMFKLTGEKGPYFEIGPKVGLLTGQREEFDYEDEDLAEGGMSGSFKNDFNSVIISLGLGFGVDIKVAENMFVTAGLRLSYGLGDALKKKDDDEIQSALIVGALTGEQEISFIQGFSSYKDGDYSGNDRDYSYKKTHIATGGLVLGFTYQFGGN